MPMEVASEGQKFERPQLDSAYVAPRNDVERMLVGMFEELLGVQGVGVQDSFFDLGGHSLIAVRLFARVKKTWAVDFPLSLLFEAPTVEKVAARVAEVAGITDSGAAPVVAAPVRRYEFLVPMHEGEGGPKTPFFLVAGMFGNVLNLRHLAQLVGRDHRVRRSVRQDGRPKCFLWRMHRQPRHHGLPEGRAQGTHQTGHYACHEAGKRTPP